MTRLCVLVALLCAFLCLPSFAGAAQPSQPVNVEFVTHTEAVTEATESTTSIALELATLAAAESLDHMRFPHVVPRLRDNHKLFNGNLRCRLRDRVASVRSRLRGCR